MSANDKAAATYHPHPSYVAVEAAWDPDRRQKLTDALARSIDKYTRPTIIRDISKQKRPKR